MIEKLKGFVAAGGLILTSNRALSLFHEQAFPEFIQSRGVGGRSLPYTIYASVDLPSPLLDPRIAEAFEHESSQNPPEWGVAARSDLVKIVNPERVAVILSSESTLRERVGEDGLVYYFDFGFGNVYHFTPTFLTQEFQEPPRVIRVAEIIDYVKVKSGNDKKTVAMARELIKKHGAPLFHVEALRSVLTRSEVLIRLLLMQKQRATGPIVELQAPIAKKPNQVESGGGNPEA